MVANEKFLRELKRENGLFSVEVLLVLLVLDVMNLEGRGFLGKTCDRARSAPQSEDW